MKTLPYLTSTVALALAGFFLATAPVASAFPRTKEKADLTINFALAATDPLSTASGTASVGVTIENDVETVTPLTISLTGLAAGSYGVAATLADATVVPIGTATVTATPGSEDLTLPVDLDPLDIATLTVSDATPTVVLSGTPTLAITKWVFSANVKVTAPTPVLPAPPTGPKPKKVHGHVLVHAKIINDVEEKRKFLLVAHGGPADTVLTINLDGVAAGTLTTTKKGKMMVKALTSDVRLAGVRFMTLTDPANVVVAEADFFPDAD
jgi:hypothetical protein